MSESMNRTKFKEFVEISKKFSPDCVLDTRKEVMKILNCGEEISCRNCGSNEFSEAQSCLGCGEYTKRTLHINKNSTDYYTSTTTLIHSYERYTHFGNVLRNLQGRQCRFICDDVFSKITEKVNDLGIDPKTLNHKSFRNILKMCNLNKYYRDSEMIMMKLFKIPPPLVLPTFYNPLLKHDFVMISNRFEKIKGKKRKSFINYPYVIFTLLTRKYGIDLKENDFNLPKTKKKRKYNEDTLAQIFKDLDWDIDLNLIKVIRKRQKIDPG